MTAFPLTRSSSVLVTANVFQNCLPGLRRNVGLSITLLNRFNQQPIRWYISEIDYETLLLYWYYFGEFDSPCAAAYLGMLQRVHPCVIDSRIQVEAQEHPMRSVSDSVRLACAIDRQVDALVTWEPHHFAKSHEHRVQLEEQGFFDYQLTPEMADMFGPENFGSENDISSLQIFSVNAFAQQLI